jgi:dienelactone hydrolase
MKQLKIITIAGITAIGLCMSACNNQPASQEKTASATDTSSSKIKTETVTYLGGDTTMNSFVAYDQTSDKKRPAVLIIPEWWGVNEYVKGRARQLAALGYIAMAVDVYGYGKTAPTPDSAMKLAAPFYKDPHIAKTRFDAALEKIKTYPQTDAHEIAAIGYCFGGAQVLNLARQGEDLKGVVSFHGNLIGAVKADKSLLKAKILVCHGEADQFVKPAEVAAFKKQMDSIGADYTLKIYPGATHAFTNPDATANGQKFNMPIAYNGAADTASWNEMKMFFNKIFK